MGAFLRHPHLPILASGAVVLQAIREGMREGVRGLRVGEEMYDRQGLPAVDAEKEALMDVTVLVKDVIPFLAPFLPYLLKAGEKAAEEAGKNLGEAAWERAKALWGRLRPKVEAKPAALEAAQDVASQPDDEDAQTALRLQLKKLLAEDQALAAQVARLWEETKAADVSMSTIGPRSVAIDGNVSGSTMITGDRTGWRADRPSCGFGACGKGRTARFALRGVPKRLGNKAEQLGERLSKLRSSISDDKRGGRSIATSSRWRF